MKNVVKIKHKKEVLLNNTQVATIQCKRVHDGLYFKVEGSLKFSIDGKKFDCGCLHHAWTYEGDHVKFEYAKDVYTWLREGLTAQGMDFLRGVAKYSTFEGYEAGQAPAEEVAEEPASDEPNKVDISSNHKVTLNGKQVATFHCEPAHGEFKGLLAFAIDGAKYEMVSFDIAWGYDGDFIEFTSLDDVSNWLITGLKDGGMDFLRKVAGYSVNVDTPASSEAPMEDAPKAETKPQSQQATAETAPEQTPKTQHSVKIKGRAVFLDGEKVGAIEFNRYREYGGVVVPKGSFKFSINGNKYKMDVSKYGYANDAKNFIRDNLRTDGKNFLTQAALLWNEPE